MWAIAHVGLDSEATIKKTGNQIAILLRLHRQIWFLDAIIILAFLSLLKCGSRISICT